MTCRFLKVSSDDNNELIKEAAVLLNSGGLLILPTETVYGLAGDASNPHAIERIYRIKGRSFDKPLAISIASFDQLDGLTSEITSDARSVMERFWPGPLTLIFKPSPAVGNDITRGSGGVGIRFPDHPLLLGIIREFGRPIVLTSANLSGRPSPVTLAEAEELFGQVDLVIDGAKTSLGRESTVLDLTQNPPAILREGAILPSQFEGII